MVQSLLLHYVYIVEEYHRCNVKPVEKWTKDRNARKILKPRVINIINALNLDAKKIRKNFFLEFNLVQQNVREYPPLAEWLQMKNHELFFAQINLVLPNSTGLSAFGGWTLERWLQMKNHELFFAQINLVLQTVRDYPPLADGPMVEGLK